jgi:hypothetical protein
VWVSTLALKLLLTPAFVGAVSLAGRRWGAAASGLLVGLPLTSGPVAFFLALDQGTAFAAHAAVATLAGVMSVAAFAVVYGRAAARLDWPGATVLGWAAYLGATLAFRSLPLSILPVSLAVVLSLLVALLLIPRSATAPRKAETPWWDIPARMLSATLFVVLLTVLAGLLGPRMSGLLAPFPIYGTVLAVATHRFEGSAATTRLLRGLMAGSFAFAAFFLVLALTLERSPLGLAFGAAVVAALAAQGFAARGRWREIAVDTAAGPSSQSSGRIRSGGV